MSKNSNFSNLTKVVFAKKSDAMNNTNNAELSVIAKNKVEGRELAKLEVGTYTHTYVGQPLSTTRRLTKLITLFRD